MKKTTEIILRNHAITDQQKQPKDDSPSAADGSEALWGTTTTLKEDLQAGYEHKNISGVGDAPIVIGSELYEKIKKENPGLIKEQP